MRASPTRANHESLGARNGGELILDLRDGQRRLPAHLPTQGFQQLINFRFRNVVVFAQHGSFTQHKLKVDEIHSFANLTNTVFRF